MCETKKKLFIKSTSVSKRFLCFTFYKIETRETWTTLWDGACDFYFIFSDYVLVKERQIDLGKVKNDFSMVEGKCTFE